MSTIELPVPYTPRGLRARRLSLRHAVRGAGWALLGAVVLAWALLFRPQFLGGPAAYVMVSGMSMEPSLRNGDLVIAHRRDRYRVGDTIVYRVPKGDAGAGSMIIHRIVGGSAASGWKVRGDNRDIPDLWQPKGNDIVGSTWVRVPGVGTLLAYALSPLALATLSTLLALLIGVPAAAVEAVESRSRRRKRSGLSAAAALMEMVSAHAAGPDRNAVVRVPVARHRPMLNLAPAWGEAAWTARDLWWRRAPAQPRVKDVSR